MVVKWLPILKFFMELEERLFNLMLEAGIFKWTRDCQTVKSKLRINLFALEPGSLITMYTQLKQAVYIDFPLGDVKWELEYKFYIQL